MYTGISKELCDVKMQKMQNQISHIQGNITVSDVTTIQTLEPILAGISVSYLSIGSQFNLWGSGHFTNATSLNNGTTYYISRNTRADFIEPLQWYVGDPTVAIAAIMIGNNPTIMPLIIDNTGIRFTPSTQITGITAGNTFSYTLLLFLAPQA